MMKKIVLVTGALFLSLFAKAQNFHVEEANNPEEIYQSGDVVEVGEIGDIVTEAGYFSFKVRNNSENNIKVRAKLVEVINGLPEDGPQALQFCFAEECYDNIKKDQAYPTSGAFVEIEPGGTHIDNSGDHIVNFYEPENEGVVEYVFRFFEVNDDLEEIGEPLLLTYRYNSTLSTPDFEVDFASLQSTILKDAIDIRLEEDANLRMYDMLGKEVFNKNVASGTHHIAIPNLSSTMYFIQLNNKQGAKQTFKVVVK